MTDEFVHNNPQDPAKQIFEQLEVQVVDITHNMNLLMASLARNLKLFGCDGGSSSKNRLEGKL
jgi:hypothetical protein